MGYCQHWINEGRGRKTGKTRREGRGTGGGRLRKNEANYGRISTENVVRIALPLYSLGWSFTLWNVVANEHLKWKMLN